MNGMNTLAALTLFAAMVGCGGGEEGPATYAVTGKVTLNGDPLPTGDVIFRSKDGGHAYAAKVVDGEFTMEAEAGQKQVEITSYREIPGKTREDNPGEVVAVTEQVVPEQFNAKTELTASVEADGENAFTFDLEGEPPAAE